MSTPTLATAKENQRSTFSVDVTVGAHALLSDEPAAAGGKDLGPGPYDLLAASLAACTAMTVRWYAREHQLPLIKVNVEVTHTTKAGSGPGRRTDAFTKTIELIGADLTAEQRDTLVAVAHKCPVQRTLEGASVVTTEASAPQKASAGR